MDERRDLVDREKLRRRLGAENHVGAILLLNAMPAVECPRGWTRDEVLAELDADPDAVCEYLNLVWNDWRPMPRSVLKDWKDPDVPRPNVRVVRVTPEPEWVPLTQLVGRTIAGERVEVFDWRHHVYNGIQWWGVDGRVQHFPDGTLNLVVGLVAVRPKAAT